ncbi:hypothetical protein GCM10022239_07350 [Leifsonia bigeumensis]|uniref:Uncharacterized protein n=1 Tax=Leifsonella bigeumensis TaxID=433643 RepID=A0ABP7F8L1_9MICO
MAGGVDEVSGVSGFVVVAEHAERLNVAAATRARAATAVRLMTRMKIPLHCLKVEDPTRADSAVRLQQVVRHEGETGLELRSKL